MGVVDLLTSTAGLQIDLNADFINGLALQFQTDNLSITKVLFVEVGEKFDLQLFFCRLRTKFVQYLIFDRRLALVLNVKDFSVILIIKRQNLYAIVLRRSRSPFSGQPVQRWVKGQSLSEPSWFFSIIQRPSRRVFMSSLSSA